MSKPSAKSATAVLIQFVNLRLPSYLARGLYFVELIQMRTVVFFILAMIAGVVAFYAWCLTGSVVVNLMEWLRIAHCQLMGGLYNYPPLSLTFLSTICGDRPHDWLSLAYSITLTQGLAAYLATLAAMSIASEHSKLWAGRVFIGLALLFVVTAPLLLLTPVDTSELRKHFIEDEGRFLIELVFTLIAYYQVKQTTTPSEQVNYGVTSKVLWCILAVLCGGAAYTVISISGHLLYSLIDFLTEWLRISGCKYFSLLLCWTSTLPAILSLGLIKLQCSCDDPAWVSSDGWFSDLFYFFLSKGIAASAGILVAAMAAPEGYTLWPCRVLMLYPVIALLLLTVSAILAAAKGTFEWEYMNSIATCIGILIIALFTYSAVKTAVLKQQTINNLKNMIKGNA